MISLDLAPGTIPIVPGGVDDHHITVVYLGPDVDDEQWAQACAAVEQVAAGTPPVTGSVGGRGEFPAGDDGVPVFAKVQLPGAAELHQALAHLQHETAASARHGYTPHVTLTYAQDDTRPDPGHPGPIRRDLAAPRRPGRPLPPSRRPVITPEQRIHAHLFPGVPNEDVTRSCACGLSWEDYQVLRADEAAGRPHATATTRPVNQHGRAVDENGRTHTVSLRLDPPSRDIPREVSRAIIIDWHSQLTPGAVLTDQVTLSDAETGEPILTGTELYVYAKIGHFVIAELVTFADADGYPILDGQIDRVSIADDGTFATATTWWRVAEMRVGA